MWKRAVMILFLAAVASSVAAPVAGAHARVDRIERFETVLAVRWDDDFPLASIMRADCTSLIRVERPDGSATEIQDCQLSASPVRTPEFQGVPPSEAFVLTGGPCLWHSDYWGATAGLDVLATSISYTVTPSGHVHARSDYPAEPLVCE